MSKVRDAQVDLIQDHLVTVSTELQDARERLSLLECSLLPGAWQPRDTLAKSASLTVHRQEDRITEILRLRERVELLEQDIRAYIACLRGANCDRKKMYMLHRRYTDGAEWQTILPELFGACADYDQKQSKYRRKMFRWHESSLQYIWKHFGRPREPPEQVKEG